MIAVLSVKTMEVPGDYAEIHVKGECPGKYPGDLAEEQFFETEIIEPETFCLSPGECFEIGWSQKVQVEIGLPFKVFQDQKNELANMRLKVSRLLDVKKALGLRLDKAITAADKKDAELKGLTGMKFWQKVRFCFGLMANY